MVLRQIKIPCLKSKPITTIGVGIDNIPTEIKESKILSGNDLGQLGGVENIPDETEVNEYKLLELSDLFISLEDNPNKLKKNCTISEKKLEKNNTEEAWKTLLSFNNNNG